MSRLAETTVSRESCPNHGAVLESSPKEAEALTKRPQRVLVALALRVVAQRLRSRLLGEPASTRAADSGRQVAETLGRLGGVYTKLGQYLSIRVDWFSDEFRGSLRVLTSQAPPLPFDSIRRAVEDALGPLDRHFRDFESEPLGTASIAQVHRARLIGGPVVAVKVLRPDLTPEGIARDLRILRRLCRWLRAWTGVRAVEPLLDALALALAAEMDFEREGRAAEEIAANLADEPRIVVPRVHWQACGPGVLTIDYVAGIRFDDPQQLAERQIPAADCMAILCEAYGRQVFAHGLFHADPHTGNVFVVDENDANAPALAPATMEKAEPGPRILFLDFGLVQRLDPQLREALRRGMLALIKRDLDGMVAALQTLDAIVAGGEDLARAALQEALDAGASAALGANAATIETLVQLGKRLVRESQAFRIPTELLLYARTLAYIFALAETVAPGEDPMPRLLPHLLRFLASS